MSEKHKKDVQSMHDVDFKVEWEEEIDGLGSHAPGLDRLPSNLLWSMAAKSITKALWFVGSRQIDDRHFQLLPERGGLGGVKDPRRSDRP